MGLMSIVKDCWNNLSKATKVGVLTGVLLFGGLVSSVYAGEGVGAVKPKDVGKYERIETEKKKKEEAERKKREKEKAEERAFKEGLEEGGADDFFDDAGQRSSRILKLLSRINYTAETSDVVWSQIDHSLSLILEGINFKGGYCKGSINGVSEYRKNDGSEFGLDFEGYTRLAAKNNGGIFLSLDSLKLRTNEWGGIFGLGAESRWFDIFFRMGANHRTDVTRREFDGPFSHHGNHRYDVTTGPFSSFGVRIGDEIGGELRGDITMHSIRDKQFGLPNLMPPPDLITGSSATDGVYGNVLGTIFYKPKGEGNFVKFMARYYQYNVETDHILEDTDGNILNESTDKVLYEEYLLDLIGFVNFNGMGSEDDVIGGFDIMHIWDRYRRQLGVQAILGYRSNDNPMTQQLFQRSRSIFKVREMRAEKRLQHIAYNQKKGFHYDVCLGFWLEEPQPDHEWWIDKKLFLTAEANMTQSIGKGRSIGLYINGWLDVATGKHPGKFSIRAELFGPVSFGLFYGLEFDDISKLSATDGAKHTIGASFGTNF